MGGPAFLTLSLHCPMLPEMKNDLKHVYWLGGAPCCGKSSVARILAERLGWQHYCCDDHFDAHVERGRRDRCAALARVAEMSWDEIFMRPVAEQLRHMVEIHREEFTFVLEDLQAIPSDVPIVAEGCVLMPEIVDPLVGDSTRALWMAPTESFLRKHYRQRGDWVGQVLSQCAQPEAAFENWQARDAAFAEYVAVEASQRKLACLVVDDEQSIDRVAEQIVRLWGLA